MLTSYTAKFFSTVIPKATLLNGSFEFKDKDQVEKIFSRYPPDRKRCAILPLLHLGQEQNGGFINRGVINAVAKLTDSPPGRVHETATFYSMFRFKQPRKHVVERCNGLSCFMHKSDSIKSAIEHACNGTFKNGGSKDGMFDLHEVECLGACANAPILIIDDVYYQDLDEAKIEKIFNDLRHGKDISKYAAKNGPAAKPVTLK